MSNIWILYWWLLFLAVASGQQARTKRRREMVRVQVDSSEFVRIAEQEKGLVIKGPRVRLQGTTYVIRSGDYYYYTTVREPLALPSGLRIIDARNILL